MSYLLWVKGEAWAPEAGETIFLISSCWPTFPAPPVTLTPGLSEEVSGILLGIGPQLHLSPEQKSCFSDMQGSLPGEWQPRACSRTKV